MSEPVVAIDQGGPEWCVDPESALPMHPILAGAELVTAVAALVTGVLCVALILV